MDFLYQGVEANVFQENLDLAEDISADSRKGFIAMCNVCGKEGAYKHMPQHVEANHIRGVSHACDICSKVSRTTGGVSVHKSKNHKSI